MRAINAARSTRATGQESTEMEPPRRLEPPGRHTRRTRVAGSGPSGGAGLRPADHTAQGRVSSARGLAGQTGFPRVYGPRGPAVSPPSRIAYPQVFVPPTTFGPSEGSSGAGSGSLLAQIASPVTRLSDTSSTPGAATVLALTTRLRPTTLSPIRIEEGQQSKSVTAVLFLTSRSRPTVAVG